MSFLNELQAVTAKAAQEKADKTRAAYEALQREHEAAIADAHELADGDLSKLKAEMLVQAAKGERGLSYDIASWEDEITYFHRVRANRLVELLNKLGVKACARAREMHGSDEHTAHVLSVEVSW